MKEYNYRIFRIEKDLPYHEAGRHFVLFSRRTGNFSLLPTPEHKGYWGYVNYNLVKGCFKSSTSWEVSDGATEVTLNDVLFLKPHWTKNFKELISKGINTFGDFRANKEIEIKP